MYILLNFFPNEYPNLFLHRPLGYSLNEKSFIKVKRNFRIFKCFDMGGISSRINLLFLKSLREEQKVRVLPASEKFGESSLVHWGVTGFLDNCCIFHPATKAG